MQADDPTLHIRVFRTTDTEETISLWEVCGLTRPWNDPRADIARKVSSQPELFLVAEQRTMGGESRIVGSVMSGHDGHRGWMYYLAVSRSHRGRGLGRALVCEVEQRLAALGCPKSQLMVRSDNRQAAGFYAALGYQVNDVIVLGKRLIPD